MAHHWHITWHKLSWKSVPTLENSLLTPCMECQFSIGVNYELALRCHDERSPSSWRRRENSRKLVWNHTEKNWRFSSSPFSKTNQNQCQFSTLNYNIKNNKMAQTGLIVVTCCRRRYSAIKIGLLFFCNLMNPSICFDWWLDWGAWMGYRQQFG